MAAWNHTIHYHDMLLDAVPEGCGRALEIGCGEGHFARKLAARAQSVDALDRDAEVLRRAMRGAPENVCFVEGDFMTRHFAAGSYDYVTALAVLHHLSLGLALERMKRLLAPGGVLAILGLFRERSPTDWLLSGLAWPVSRVYRLTNEHVPMNAPQQDPRSTLGEIRDQAARILPGSRLRRHVLFRYSLFWRAPRELLSPAL